MTRESFYRLSLRGLALSFALAGASFLLAPDATVRSLDAVGASIGHFSRAPVSELRLWLTLAVAYMVLVAILAWLAARDLVRYRHLLGILAAGKATSSLLALCFYRFHSDVFVYLLTFLVDGSIALGVLAIWAGVPKLGLPATVGESERGSPPAGPAARTLAALLEALVPEGGPFPEGAATPAVVAGVVDFAGRAVGGGSFRLFLVALELSPFLLPPIRLRRFSRLPLDDRVRLLQAWEESGLWPRRQALHALKLAVMSYFYSRPEVRARLGYPRPLERVPVPGVPGAGSAP